ncbi:energy transducer TonB [Hippea alviniae]|uniref:energy transducer TonB n=1 Tax=Hippea alviniae TaxID=1279027 RepID=UPI000403358D|nr:energy transducer TonB [Hippea alviniae]
MVAAVLINSAATAFIFLPLNIHLKSNRTSKTYSVFIKNITDNQQKPKLNPGKNHKTTKTQIKLQKPKAKKIQTKKKKVYRSTKKKRKTIKIAKTLTAKSKKTISTQSNEKSIGIQNQSHTSTKTTIRNTPVKISKNSYPNIFDWIASHKFYPLSAIYNEEEGKITISFKINRNGKIENIRIIKGSFKDLNEAAIKILKDSSPIPKEILTQSGIKVPTKANINLVFKLE